MVRAVFAGAAVCGTLATFLESGLPASLGAASFFLFVGFAALSNGDAA